MGYGPIARSIRKGPGSYSPVLPRSSCCPIQSCAFPAAFRFILAGVGTGWADLPDARLGALEVSMQILLPFCYECAFMGRSR